MVLDCVRTLVGDERSIAYAVLRCNEVGYYQDGPPLGVDIKPIVTRLVNVETNYDAVSMI